MHMRQSLLPSEEVVAVAPGVELTPQQKLEARFAPKQVLKDVLASGDHLDLGACLWRRIMQA